MEMRVRTIQWLFAAGASDVLPLENTEATVLFRSDGPVHHKAFHEGNKN